MAQNLLPGIPEAGKEPVIPAGTQVILKWRCPPDVTRVEIFPVPKGNRGSKHVVQQPDCSAGVFGFVPLTSAPAAHPVRGVAYKENGDKFFDDPFVFTVEGSHGLIQSFICEGTSGGMALAGEAAEMKALSGEPVIFFYKLAPGVKSGSISGVGKIDSLKGKAHAVAQGPGKMVCTLEVSDGSNTEKQTITLEVEEEVWKGGLDTHSQDWVENHPFSDGLDIAGADQSLIKRFWVSGPDGDSRTHVEIERGQKVIFHWDVSDDLDRVEIASGLMTVPGLAAPGSPIPGAFDSPEFEPQTSSDFVLSVFDRHRFARARVYVGVHGEGEAVSEGSGLPVTVTFKKEESLTVYKSPEISLGKYVLFEFSFGVNF